MKQNKKGVSGVIVTVLMILIVIAAVVIVWVFVKPFIEDNLARTGNVAECLQLDIDVEEAWVEGTLADDAVLKAKVKRVSGPGDIDEIRFLVERIDTQETEIISMTSSSDEWPDVGEIRVYETAEMPDVDADPYVTGTFKARAYIGEDDCGDIGEATVEDLRA